MHVQLGLHRPAFVPRRSMQTRMRRRHRLRQRSILRRRCLSGRYRWPRWSRGHVVEFFEFGDRRIFREFVRVNQLGNGRHGRRLDEFVQLDQLVQFDQYIHFHEFGWWILQQQHHGRHGNGRRLRWRRVRTVYGREEVHEAAGLHGRHLHEQRVQRELRAHGGT